MSGIKDLKLIALDSNIFIYNLEQNRRWVRYTDIIFQSLISKRLKAVTSIVSLIEMLSFPTTDKLEKQLIEDFYETPGLRIFEIDQKISVEAARIRRKYKFRLPDSIQLATAKLGKAKAFISNDKRLKNFKELKIILLNQV